MSFGPKLFPFQTIGVIFLTTSEKIGFGQMENERKKLGFRLEEEKPTRNRACAKLTLPTVDSSLQFVFQSQLHWATTSTVEMKTFKSHLASSYFTEEKSKHNFDNWPLVHPRQVKDLGFLMLWMQNSRVCKGKLSFGGWRKRVEGVEILGMF